MADDIDISKIQVVRDTRTPAQILKDNNATTLRAALTTAHTANKTFIAITTPNTAQNSAQIKALSRQQNSVIRLMLSMLDGTD
jgi:UDP-glucose 6-dehydrogenase